MSSSDIVNIVLIVYGASGIISLVFAIVSWNKTHEAIKEKLQIMDSKIREVDLRIEMLNSMRRNEKS